MICLVIISMLIIASYMVAVCIKTKGVPHSISNTYYRLEHPMIFSLVMAGVSFTLLPVAMEIGREVSQWAMFLAALGMLLVGGAPNFRDCNDRKVHNAGAIMSLLFSQLWVSLNCPWSLMVWLAYIIYIIAMMARKKTDSAMSDFLRAKPLFWAEISALLAVYLTLIIKM